jgi:hypothetical protein
MMLRHGRRTVPSRFVLTRDTMGSLLPCDGYAEQQTPYIPMRCV